MDNHNLGPLLLQDVLNAESVLMQVDGSSTTSTTITSTSFRASDSNATTYSTSAFTSTTSTSTSATTAAVAFLATAATTSTSTSTGGGLIYYFFIAMIFCGQVTYFCGIFYFGPRQQATVAKLVKDFWTAQPDKVVTTKFVKGGGDSWAAAPQGSEVLTPVPMTVNVEPPGTKSARNLGTFKTLSVEPGSICDVSNNPDRDTMRQGMALWGLAAVWDSVEQRNAWNCLKSLHGCPLLRLARFGFQAQPSPKDLSGILNANALYTFSCGIMQLVFGGIVFASEHSTASPEELVNMAVPWSISFLSLILSFVNIIMDFSGMLVAQENEENMAESIQTKFRLENRHKTEELEAEHRQKCADIDAKYKQRAKLAHNSGPTLALEKKREHEEEFDRHRDAVQQFDEQGLALLEVQLMAYRAYIDRVEEALSGKTKLKTTTTAARMQQSERGQRVAEQQREAIVEKKHKQLEGLTEQLFADKLTAAEFKERKLAIEKECKDMLDVVDCQD